MRFIAFIILLLSTSAEAIEQVLKGIIDLRSYYVKGDHNARSYLQGNYGKYNYDEGAGLALGQLGVHYHASINDNLTGNIVVNAYADGVNNGIGLTEAFLAYKTLPSRQGWRFKTKLGLFYPRISMENTATAWSSPYTLTSSSLNNWLAEEVRHSGLSFTMEKLGKFIRSDHDFLLDITSFQNNDTSGALLAWHGWTMGNRQTLLQEKIPLPTFAARSGVLADQAANSDPFIELDNRWGTHIVGQWQWQKQSKVNLGYYDNNADTSVVINGQYAWATRFLHLGARYKLSKQVELISQFMHGNTYMRSPDGNKVVNNNFDNGYLLLRKYWQQHHWAFRLEIFSVDDLDATLGDNNNETGKSATLSYRYALNKHSFLYSEINLINSKRPAREYIEQNINLTERQWLASYRYFF